MKRRTDRFAHSCQHQLKTSNALQRLSLALLVLFMTTTAQTASAETSYSGAGNNKTITQPETTWYVDASVSVGGDGKSKETAFNNLKEALDAASQDEGESHTIMIASTSYSSEYGTEVNSVKYTGDGNVGLEIDKNNLTIKTYGDGNAIFDAQGQNTRIWTVNANTINIIGLTFQNGISGTSQKHRDGGAISFTRNLSNSTINATFINNTAYGNGGAIYFNGSVNNVNIDATFINNSAVTTGSAIYTNSTTDKLDITGTFTNNTGKDMIYVNNANSETVIHDAVIVNNDAEYLINIDSGEADGNHNWFGNTADDYKTRANVAENVFMEDWLFLDATANPEEIELGGNASVVFNLYSYNSTTNKTSDYDASGMNILLYLTRTKGELDKTTASLGTAIDYTATVVGNGSVTGSFGNVEYTIPITVNKISTEISIANASIGLTIGEGVNAGATLTPAEAGNLSYSSNDATIASVDAAGNISALKEGTTTIAVSFAGKDNFAAAESKTIEVTVNSNVTAIGKLDTRTGEESADGDEWYSIDGRKLNGKPDAKGLYIKNGKKVVIKE